MRPVPLLTALIVTVGLYFLILDRDRLDAFLASQSVSATAPVEEIEAPVEDALAQLPGAPAQPQAPDAPPLAEVDIEEVPKVIAMRSVAQQVDNAVILRGETEPLRSVSVQAETTGTVISAPLPRGERVVAGQVLCQINPGTRPAALAEAEARLVEARAQRATVNSRLPEAEARLEEARARLEEARINVNAAESLQQDGFASETRVANARAALRSAEAGVRSAEAGLESARAGLDTLEASIQSASAAVQRAQTELDRLTVTAPFAGVLEQDTAELGTLLQAGGPNGATCATVYQLDPIRLTAYVSESDVDRLQLGAPAQARLANGAEVTGAVQFVARNSDPTTRTFRVELTAPNPELSIRAGQTAELIVRAEGVNAHLLPQSALTLNDEGTMGVRTVTADERAMFMPVQVLRDTRRGIWVSGLPDEVDVITVGQEYVTDGVRIAASYEDVIQ